MLFQKILLVLALVLIALGALSARAQDVSIPPAQVCVTGAEALFKQQNPGYFHLGSAPEEVEAIMIHSKRRHQAAKWFRAAQRDSGILVTLYRDATTGLCAESTDGSLPQHLHELMPAIKASIAEEKKAVAALVAMNACSMRLYNHPERQKIGSLITASNALQDKHMETLKHIEQEEPSRMATLAIASQRQRAHEDAYVEKLFTACSDEALHNKPATPEMFVKSWAESIARVEAVDAAVAELIAKK